MKAAIIDLETTGLLMHPQAKPTTQPRCIEFGAVVVDGEGQELDTIQLLIDPGQKLESVITKITGLTDEDLAGKPTFDAVADQIAALIEGCDAIIAHNLPFDSGVLDWEFHLLDRKIKWPRVMYCTVAEDLCEYGYRVKLQNLFREVTEQSWKQTHRALDDCRALAAVVFGGDHLEDIKWALR